jgi:hypothetical protein
VNQIAERDAPSEGQREAMNTCKESSQPIAMVKAKVERRFRLTECSSAKQEGAIKAVQELHPIHHHLCDGQPGHGAEAAERIRTSSPNISLNNPAVGSKRINLAIDLVGYMQDGHASNLAKPNV